MEASELNKADESVIAEERHRDRMDTCNRLLHWTPTTTQG